MTATLDGEKVTSSTLTDERWSSVRSEYRARDLRMTCGGKAIPKTSSRGLRFFAHRPGGDCGLHLSGPETAEHQAAKLTLAEAARAAGWDAQVEEVAPDRTWIADVLITKGNTRVALEVQWSSQTEATFEMRTQRYEASGISCVWFLGPANHRRQVPGAYLVSGDTDELTGTFPAVLGQGYSTTVPLRDGAERLFRREYPRAAEVRASKLEVTMVKAQCFTNACHQWYYRWFVTSAVGTSRCGRRVAVSLEETWEPMWGRFAQDRPELRIQKEVRPLLTSGGTPSCRYGRRSSAQAPEGYIAALCPHCGVMQGDAFFETSHRVPYAVDVAWSGHITLDVMHWCPDAGNGSCTSAWQDQTVFPLPHQPYSVTFRPEF